MYVVSWLTACAPADSANRDRESKREIKPKKALMARCIGRSIAAAEQIRIVGVEDWDTDYLNYYFNFKNNNK